MREDLLVERLWARQRRGDRWGVKDGLLSEAADEIERYEEIRKRDDAMIKRLQAEIERLRDTLYWISKPPDETELCKQPDPYGHHVCGKPIGHKPPHGASWTDGREWT